MMVKVESVNQNVQDQESLFRLVEDVLRNLRNNTKRKFKSEKISITVDQWLVLEKIASENGVNQTLIARHTNKDPAAITRTLDVLSKKGLIERKVKPNDRRSYLVYLTVQGIGLVGQIKPMVQNIHLQGTRYLEPHDRNALMSGLNKLGKGLTEK